jgi:hypothetical protein
MDEISSQNEHEFSNIWAIHAERDGQPWLRDWAKTETEASEKMSAFKTEDDDAASTEYWVMRMTTAELESFQLAELIPAELK